MGMRRIHGIAVAAVVLAVAGLAFAFTGDSPTGEMTSAELDEFAQCLADNNATFYGAYWCPHCNRQKAMFGDAMEHVDYVECSPNGKDAPQAEICQRKGISGYPTWIIQGERYSGVQSFEDLAVAADCELPR